MAHDNAGGHFGGVYNASTWVNYRRVDRPSVIESHDTPRRPAPEDLRVLILGHDRQRLSAAPVLPHGRKIYLAGLHKDIFTEGNEGTNSEIPSSFTSLPSVQKVLSGNSLAESRLFHWTDLEQALDREYVALCTDRWDGKYRDAALPLVNLDLLERSPAVVWAACRTPHDWILDSEKHHPGMAEILWKLVDHFGLTDADLRRPSLWSNNLLAHRDVVLDLAAFHRALLPQILERYGAHPPYESPDEKPPRHLSYLAERFTVLYFCSRGDLEVRQIPAR